MIVMHVKERMNPEIVSITSQARLVEARRLLDQHQIGHLPVVEQGKLVGLITDRDIRSASSAAPLERGRVAEAMTREVITVAPGTPVQEAAKLMVTHRIGCLPVLKGSVLQGIITETDLLNALVEIMNHATLERIAPDYRQRTMTVVDL